MRGGRRTAAAAAGGFFGLVVLGLVDSAGGGVGLTDEVWFLQVATRVADGDVLYRDVFFNTTPLSLQLAAIGVGMFGSGILVVKFLAAFGLAASGIGCAYAARELGASGRSSGVLAVACVAGPGLAGIAPYTVLAIGGLACCLAATLAWQRRGASHLLALAAAAGGLAFSFKHSTGLLALAALAAGVLLARHRATRQALAAAGTALIACVVVPLLPVLVQGGGPKLLEYGVTAKGTYVEAGSISYWRGVADFAALAGGVAGTGPLPPFGNAASNPRLLFFLLPFIVLPLLALAVARPGPLPRPAVATAAAFVVAGLISAWPRVDLYHLLTAAPLLVFGLWLGAHALLRDRVRAVARRGGVAVAGLALIGMAAGPAVFVLREDWRPSRVPHLRGTLMAPELQAEVRRRGAALAASARSGPVFVLSADAALRHLVGGIANRTPYDYPLITAFGLRGQDEIRQAIARRRFAAVCVSPAADRLQAEALKNVVRRSWRAAEDGVGCRMYRAGGPLLADGRAFVRPSGVPLRPPAGRPR